MPAPIKTRPKIDRDSLQVLCTAVFSELGPVNPSLFGRPQIPTLSSNRGDLWTLHGFPLPALQPENPLQAASVGLTSFLLFQGPVNYTYFQFLKIMFHTFCPICLFVCLLVLSRRVNPDPVSTSWLEVIIGILIPSLQTQADKSELSWLPEEFLLAESFLSLIELSQLDSYIIFVFNTVQQFPPPTPFSFLFHWDYLNNKLC